MSHPIPTEVPDAWGCTSPWLGTPSPCSPTCISKPETPFHNPAVECSCPMLETPICPVGAGLKPSGIGCIATHPVLSQIMWKPGAFHPIAEQIWPQGNKDRRVQHPTNPSTSSEGLKWGQQHGTSQPAVTEPGSLLKHHNFLYLHTQFQTKLSSLH